GRIGIFGFLFQKSENLKDRILCVLFILSKVFESDSGRKNKTYCVDPLKNLLCTGVQFPPSPQIKKLPFGEFFYCRISDKDFIKKSCGDGGGIEPVGAHKAERSLQSRCETGSRALSPHSL
ncbi:MAG: hypothetical protein QG585_208, partial [Patescibacteria group bacterium]|nr:hypothetical protein [Patescibacteria group bacterium]